LAAAKDASLLLGACGLNACGFVFARAFINGFLAVLLNKNSKTQKPLKLLGSF